MRLVNLRSHLDFRAIAGHKYFVLTLSHLCSIFLKSLAESDIVSIHSTYVLSKCVETMRQNVLVKSNIVSFYRLTCHDQNCDDELNRPH